MMFEPKKNLVDIEDFREVGASIELDSRDVKGGIDRSSQQGAHFFDEADALFGKRTSVKKES